MTDFLIPSISYNQYEILQWIIKLHLKGERIGVDPTFGKGMFYRNKRIKLPEFVSDADPYRAGNVDGVEVKQHQAERLPLPDDSVGSIIFDPPFLSKTGKGSIIKDRFGDYPSMKELWNFYDSAIWEFNRILKINGILIFKCQNTVMSGKQWWSTHYIENIAEEFGFRKVDEFILLAKHRMPQHNLKMQRHARKYHSYFLVFEKQEPVIHSLSDSMITTVAQIRKEDAEALALV